MKKILFYFSLILLFIIPRYSIAMASNSDYTIQYLENGDYIVTEIISSNFNAKTSTSFDKRSFYYDQNHNLIFTTLLSATFDYSYGQHVSATSSNITVNVTASSAIFKSKTSHVSGNTAYGSGTVFYQGANRTISSSISCDPYGNMH